jgi:hypothetical protein
MLTGFSLLLSLIAMFGYWDGCGVKEKKRSL